MQRTALQQENSPSTSTQHQLKKDELSLTLSSVRRLMKNEKKCFIGPDFNDICNVTTYSMVFIALLRIKKKNFVIIMFGIIIIKLYPKY